MLVLYGMPTIQYSAQSARFFKFNDLHISTSLSSVMTDMSRDSIVDRHCLRQRHVPHAVAENLGRFLVRSCTGQGNDFELTSTVNTETGHPVEGSFGNEFRSIYNHRGVMAAWSHKTLKKIDFFAFLKEKRLRMGKFSKFCSNRIHRDTDRRAVFKFREIWPAKIGKIVRTVRARKWIQYSAEA